MRRHLLGLIGVVFLVAGVFGWLNHGDSAAGSTFAGSSVRIGIVLAALWLAWPDVTRWNPWLTAASLLAVAIVVVNVRTIVIVAPILFAIWFFTLRTGRSGPPPRKPEKSS